MVLVEMDEDPMPQCSLWQIGIRGNETERYRNAYALRQGEPVALASP